MLLPTGHTHHRQPLHESTQISIFLLPQREMPTIRHQTIAKNTHGPLFQSVRDDPFKRQIILVVEKQLIFANAPIENVINLSPGRDASCWYLIDPTYPP